MRSSLDRIIELQDEELWRDGKAPEVEDDFLASEIHMDIWTVPRTGELHKYAHGWIYLGSNYRNTLIISSGLHPPPPPPPHHHHH